MCGKFLFFTLLASLSLMLAACSPQEREEESVEREEKQAEKGVRQDFPMVEISTNMGSFRIELDAKKAPISTENFLEYIRNRHYEGLIFHRVIAGFVAQGGGHDVNMNERPTRDPIANESDNGLSNVKYSIAMARTNDPDSATSQFYLNLADNKFLDAAPGKDGYTVFGRAVSGTEVIDAIGLVKTGGQDVPVESIVIESAKVLD